MNELGEWLSRAREARGLTLHDAERDTRISRRYLQALESGELDVIPAPVYARGFLRSYAQYLGLDPQEAMARYPRAEETPAQQPAQRPNARQQQKPQQQRDRQPQQPQHEPAIGASAPPTGSRPAWRRPGPGTPAEATAVGQSAPAPRTRPVPMPRNEPVGEEPMIGVDIGVPVPSRRLQQDPDAQKRSMAVLAVAIIAIAAILFLAFAISRLGGDDDLDPASPTSAVEGAGDDSEPEATPDTPIPTLGGNGLVPDVEGDTEDTARAAIEAAGLVPNVIYEPTDAVSPGIVLTQSPGPGIQRSPGDPMTIVVSEAP
jgi:cytoskeleton protein RodZ